MQRKKCPRSQNLLFGIFKAVVIREISRCSSVGLMPNARNRWSQLSRENYLQSDWDPVLCKWRPVTAKKCVISRANLPFSEKCMLENEPANSKNCVKKTELANCEKVWYQREAANFQKKRVQQKRAPAECNTCFQQRVCQDMGTFPSQPSRKSCPRMQVTTSQAPNVKND